MTDRRDFLKGAMAGTAVLWATQAAAAPAAAAGPHAFAPLPYATN
ncbi:MAG: twin-arginine translocation signal domain-containing protein, partial [Gammaproteobacteria bacterium]